MLRPRRFSSAKKTEFLADEDLPGGNVLLLTSLLQKVLKVPREKVCYRSMSLYHIITKIGTKTLGTSGNCHSVEVDLDNCTASLDGAHINKSTTASVDGVRLSVRRSCTHVSVPNCEVSKRMTMWVT